MGNFMSIINATFQVCYERQPHLCSIPWGIFIGIVTIIILKKKNEIKNFIMYFINYKKNTTSNTTSTPTSKNKSTMSSNQNLTDMMSKLFGDQSPEFLTETAIEAQELQVKCRNGDELTEEQLLLLSKNPAFGKMNGGHPSFLKFINLIGNLSGFNLYYESNPGAGASGEATGFGNLFIDGLTNLFCNDDLRSLIGAFVQKNASIISKLEFEFVTQALESKTFSPEEIRSLQIYRKLLSSSINRKIDLRCQAYEMNEKDKRVACYSFAVASRSVVYGFVAERILGR